MNTVLVIHPSFSRTKWNLRGRFAFATLGMASMAYLSLLSVVVALSLRFEVNLYQKLASLGFAFLFGLGWLLFQWLVSPLFMNFVISATFGVHVVHFKKRRDAPLPDWFVDYLEQQVETTKVGIKKVLILKDETMNAFVYGHGHWNGRLAVSAGLFKYLNKEEVKAVIGHELSHVKNNDFILITAATGFPLFTAFCYSFLRELSRNSDTITSVVYPIILGLAIFTRFLYTLSMLFLLTLTRTREAMADFGSIATYGNTPRAMSTALLKVGYGLLDITPQGNPDAMAAFLPTEVKVVENMDDETQKKARMEKTKPSETRKVIGSLGFMSHFRMNCFFTEWTKLPLNLESTELSSGSEHSQWAKSSGCSVHTRLFQTGLR